MAGQQAPDEPGIPLENCAAAPPSWQLGRHRFERMPKAEAGPGSRGRWGVSNGRLGVSNYRTPVGAYLALRRFARQPAGPCD